MQKWEIAVLCFTFGSLFGFGICAIFSIDPSEDESPHFIPEEDSRLD